MTKRSTKHSLFMSAIALLLCCSMLIGTTFAWFTDSVTSAGNIIKSGTLKVSLDWADGKTDPTNTTWNDASTSKIFNYDKWEPGYTDVKHIKITNDGTLALKYTVTITAYDNNGAALNPTAVSELADVIDVYYLDPAQQIADRNAFDAIPVDNKLGTLRQVLMGLSTTANGTLLAEDGKNSDTVTLALKMQENAGNEYQNKDIGATFAVTLFATQLDSEIDSFDKDYDIDADYPASSSIYLAKKDDTGMVSEGDVTVYVKAPADGSTFTLQVVDNGVTNDNGEYTAAYDIKLDLNGKSVDATTGVEYTVTINVGSMLDNVKVTHNGVAVTPVNYDKFTGLVTFTTDSFSPFTVSYTIPETVVLESGEYDLSEDVATSVPMVIEEGATVVINLDRKVNGSVKKNSSGVIHNKGTLTINGGTIENLTANGDSTIRNSGTLIIDGSTIIGADREGDSWPSYPINNAGDMTIKNATIEGNHGTVACYGGGKTEVENCNITINGQGTSSHLFYIYDAGTEVIVNGGNYVHNGNVDGSLAYVINGTFTVKGGTFTASNGAYGFATASGSAVINIEGGKINNNLLHWYANDGAAINITGGEFAVKPDAKWIADGYIATENADGTWTVGRDYVFVETPEDLQTALGNGEDVALSGDVSVPIDTAQTAPYGNKTAVSHAGGIFDGQGNDISLESGADHYTVMTSGGTIKNLNVVGGFRGIMIMYADETIHLDNVYVGGPSVGYALNTGEGDSTQDLIVTNSSFYGWNSWSLLKSASFTNCTFGQGTYWGATSLYGRIARPYVDTVFTECQFNADGYILDISNLNGTIDLVDCTLNGELITAANYSTLVDLTDLNSGGAELMAKVKVNGTLVFDEANQ